MKIIALMTCHNRRDKTLDCLRLLAAQKPCGAELEVIVVDDGSTDGTATAIATEFPDVRILEGNGSLYWCGGMRMAWRAAAEEDPDFYLLLNDDTHLYPDALQTISAVSHDHDDKAIVVGAICDPDTGEVTYGGLRSPHGLIPANGPTEPCHTFNANCVLIPRSVYHILGPLHERYTHGMGDYDYGWQATRRGIKLVQTGKYIGTCMLNSTGETWRDRTLPRRKRLQLLESPKGFPFRERVCFNFRNSGWKWPLYVLSPLIRIVFGR
jgi:GT2 family glycosyltransferase